MQVSNQSIGSSSLLRQNILEKANQAFSGGEKAEEFSKKINDAINSVADSQNKAAVPPELKHIIKGRKRN